MENCSASTGRRHRAVLLLGPTGSGKTPLGEVCQAQGLWGGRCMHFDFGENLRQVVAGVHGKGFFSGEEIAFLRRVLTSGALLEDSQFPIARRVLQSFLVARAADSQTCILLNGLPRHAGQAQAMEGMVDMQAVIRLQCSSEAVFARIQGNTGGDRTGRIDDDLAAVQNKLDIFRRRTAPLVEHYRKLGVPVVTLKVTAAMSPQEAWQALDNGLQRPDGRV